MKKITWFVIIAIGLIVTISSCSKTETYADKLKSERKTIKRFIKDNDIELIDTYPANGVFKENQFFVDTKTGVYFNVVDSGNGRRARATTPRSEVYFRYKESRLLPDTTQYSNVEGGLQPLSLTYGLSTTYKSSTDADAYYFLSPAIAAPLLYVGEEAIVKIIIPFNAGSAYQASYFIPAYCGYVKYTKID